MNDSKKDHWASLANSLGFEVPEEELSQEESTQEPASPDEVQETAQISTELEEDSDVEIPSTETEVPQDLASDIETNSNVVLEDENTEIEEIETVSSEAKPTVVEEAPPLTKAVDKPKKSKPKKSHWGSIASLLGLESKVEEEDEEEAVDEPLVAELETEAPSEIIPESQQEESSIETPKQIDSEKPDDHFAAGIFAEKIERSESEKTASKLFFGTDEPPKKVEQPKKSFHDDIFQDKFVDEPEADSLETDDESDDEQVSSDSSPDKKRRRRRGRSRGKKDYNSLESDFESTEEDVQEDDIDADGLESNTQVREEEEEDSDRPKRRRRRRRSKKTEDSSKEKSFDEDEFDSDSKRNSSEKSSSRKASKEESLGKKKNIPSWLDAIGCIVEDNIERHRKIASQYEGRSKDRGGRPRKRKGSSGKRNSRD